MWKYVGNMKKYVGIHGKYVGNMKGIRPLVFCLKENKKKYVEDMKKYVGNTKKYVALKLGRAKYRAKRSASRHEYLSCHIMALGLGEIPRSPHIDSGT